MKQDALITSVSWLMTSEFAREKYQLMHMTPEEKLIGCLFEWLIGWLMVCCVHKQVWRKKKEILALY